MRDTPCDSSDPDPPDQVRGRWPRRDCFGRPYAAEMSSAQEAFRAMLKEHVAPSLRALGFKGSGQNYQLPSDTHWALVGFQKSEFSDSETITFTINLQVIRRSDWDEARRESPWMGERPTATTTWGLSLAWSKRIGQLTPSGEDLWWTFRAGTDTTQLAGAVLWAIEDFALPAIREQLGRSA